MTIVIVGRLNFVGNRSRQVVDGDVIYFVSLVAVAAGYELLVTFHDGQQVVYGLVGTEEGGPVQRRALFVVPFKGGNAHLQQPHDGCRLVAL